MTGRPGTTCGCFAAAASAVFVRDPTIATSHVRRPHVGGATYASFPAGDGERRNVRTRRDNGRIAATRFFRLYRAIAR
ncbi:hypothetical protein Vau01_078530 [Virgisporangium aurantiacum]|uniref:Uncharacterized protein n=1 Tax=Virgisporangium aurantiacum TaxID=175570 RepID=A0A8J3ZCD6_9ACTN|nr:hypothetical protein Vau01_078530 [Virgisporangium aurantiacum]